MANLFSTLATAQNTATTNGADRPSLPSYGGKLTQLDIAITATAATADPLYLLRLPKGARLLADQCSVDYEDPGTSVVCHIGDFTTASTPVVIDVDRYATSLDLGSAAGRKEFSEAGTKGVAFLTPYVTTADTWIVVTFSSVGAGVSAAYNFHLVYTLG